MNGKNSGAVKMSFIMMASFAMLPCLDATAQDAGAPKAPDIILVVVDSLRADHLGSYGYGRDTSPSIDEFASRSVRFENAFASSSWTLPALSSIHTSTTPDVHRNFHWNLPYSTNVITLAQALHDAGYQTVGITCNPMTSRKYGFHRGFDLYDDFSISLPPGADAGDSAAQAATGATMTRLAQAWLATRRDKSKPLFMFLLYMDPHWDYLPPAPYDTLFTDDPIPPPRGIWKLGEGKVADNVRNRTIAAYDGEIRYTDTCISNLLCGIESSPRGSNTLIAVCADHGEAFWERGFASHGNNLHDEEIHVPLIISPPGGSRQGGVVNGQVGTIDLARTFLDYAGVEPPDVWLGRSLRPLVEEGDVEGEVSTPVVLDLRILKNHVPLRTVRTPRYKLIAPEPFISPSGVYDLAADPGETNNLVKPGAPLSAEVAALMPLLKPAGENEND